LAIRLFFKLYRRIVILYAAHIILSENSL